MKFALLASALFVSLAAQAKGLVEYNRNEGFSPRPGFETLTIEDNGDVHYQSEYTDRFHHGTVTKEDKIVAKLSADGLKALKKQLSQIKAKDLQDQNPGPQCTDAPSTSMYVIGGRNNVEFHATRGCHTYVNETLEATKVKSLIEGLLSLSAM